MTEQNEEQQDYSMSELEEGLDYWGINPPDEIKELMLKQLNIVHAPESIELGKEFTLDAFRILNEKHDDADLFRRSLLVPGLKAAIANHQTAFAEFLSDTLGLDWDNNPGGMPPRETARVIVMGVDIAMVLGFMAGQAVKREVALDSLWGSSPATKEQVAEAEAQRESNEGLDGLTFEETDSSQLGGECMECGFNYENEAEFTKHALAEHSS
jgi:hypothetical protein